MFGRSVRRLWGRAEGLEDFVSLSFIHIKKQRETIEQSRQNVRRWVTIENKHSPLS